MPTIKISCSCCKATEGKLLYSGLKSVYTDTPYSIVLCNNCSNGITFPSVDKEDLNKIYSKTYLYPIHLLALGEKKYRSRAMAKYIRVTTPVHSHPKVLEIGCMFGYLLQELQSEYKVKGIDIGDDAVHYCQQQGLDVQDSSIEDFLNSSSEKFDIIVISHVLEHLLEPDLVLKQLEQNLNPEGRIYILVPNYQSISAKLFGHNWGWWQVPVHINHFNENSLGILSDKAGFEKVEYRRRGGDSLMLLLNLINLFSFHNENKSPGPFQKMTIKIFTSIFRYWYKLGNEELTMVFKLKQQN